MRSLDALPRCAVAIVCLFAFFTASAQQTIPPQTQPPGSSTQAPTSPDENDPVARRMATQLALKRNTTRQQEIIDDTAKLLDLAKQLKAEVDKSSKDQLSLSVVKKAEEIEKLAKSVREKMKNGQ
jgi:type VI protein secretion system component VasF